LIHLSVKLNFIKLHKNSIISTSFISIVLQFIIRYRGFFIKTPVSDDRSCLIGWGEIQLNIGFENPRSGLRT
jgi:hypothetical protein